MHSEKVPYWFLLFNLRGESTVRTFVLKFGWKETTQFYFKSLQSIITGTFSPGGAFRTITLTAELSHIVISQLCQLSHELNAGTLIIIVSLDEKMRPRRISLSSPGERLFEKC